MNAAIRIIGICSILFAMSACSELDIFEDDVDVSANDRTTDITAGNMESIASSAIDGAYLGLAQSSLFLALDANEAQAIDCVGGSVDVTASAAPGEEHSAGDRLTLEYSDCMLADGTILNGRVSFRYTSIQGLNNRFIPQTIEQCVAELSGEISGIPQKDPLGTILNDEDIVLNFEDGEYYPADLVSFTQVSENSEAIFLKFSEPDVNGSLNLEPAPPIGVNPLDVESILVEENKIFVVLATEVDEARSIRGDLRYRLKADAVPSLEDGDIVYSVVNGLSKVEDCQEYERRLTASATNLSVELPTGEVSSLNGTMALIDSNADFETAIHVIESSNFTVRYERLAGIGIDDLDNQQVFSMENFTVELTLNFGDAGSGDDASIAYAATGNISSASFPGKLNVSTGVTLRTASDDYRPQSGRFQVLGRDLETVNIIFSGEPVIVSAATLGDTNGSGRPNIDEQVNTFWQDLLDRNFLQAE